METTAKGMTSGAREDANATTNGCLHKTDARNLDTQDPRHHKGFAEGPERAEGRLSMVLLGDTMGNSKDSCIQDDNFASEISVESEKPLLQRSSSRISDKKDEMSFDSFSISTMASEFLFGNILWEAVEKLTLKNHILLFNSSSDSPSESLHHGLRSAVDRLASRANNVLSPRALWQIMSVVQWSFFNVLSLLMNNQIFQSYGFKFPLSLTLIHFFISFLGAFLFIEILGLQKRSHVEPLDHLYWVIPMAAASSFNVVLGNFSLRYIPLQFLQTVRSFAPVITVFLQRVFLGRILNAGIYLSLIPVVLGAILSYAPELHLDLVSFLSAFASSVIGSCTVILAELLLQHKTNNLDSLNSLYHMLPYSLTLLVFPAFFFEGQQLVDWFHSITNVSAVISALLFSGVIAFCLNFSLFFTLQSTSAVTFNVAGNLKVALTVLVSWLLFSSQIKAISLFGCMVTVLGVCWYGFALYNDRQEKIQARTLDGLSVEDIEVDQVVDVYFGNLS